MEEEDVWVDEEGWRKRKDGDGGRIGGRGRKDEKEGWRKRGRRNSHESVTWSAVPH